MAKISENSPLTISEDAQIVIEDMRKRKKYSKKSFLRVKAVIPQYGDDAVTFNMYFDEETGAKDMAYKEGTTKIIMDAQTAYLLVGSELFQTPSGDLAFDHLDTSSCFDKDDNPIKN